MLLPGRFGARWLALPSYVLLTCSTVHAADLTLRDVIARTSAQSPQLAAFTFEAEATRQEGLARAAAPPLIVDAEFENFGGTGDVSAAGALETTLQLSKVFELGGKQPLRGALGAAELDSIDARQRASRADVIAEAARRFLHVLADQAQLEVTHRARQLAGQARDAVQARMREGAISPMFLNRAEIALARARIEEEHAEHELVASRMNLAVMWGETQPSFDRATGELFSFPQAEPLENYLARLEHNPSLLAFASEQRLADARKRLAESQRSPNVTLSAGVRRLEALDEQAFVAGFSIPLGSRTRAEPEIRASVAERERATLNATSRRFELHALVFSLYQELQHARTEANTLHTDVRPQAERMVETAAAGYREGRYSLVELIDAQQALIDLEQDSIRAALEFHTNLIEIERATGVAVHTLATR